MIEQFDESETDWDRLSAVLQPWLDNGADPHPLRLAVAPGAQPDPPDIFRDSRDPIMPTLWAAHIHVGP